MVAKPAAAPERAVARLCGRGYTKAGKVVIGIKLDSLSDASAGRLFAWRPKDSTSS